MNAKEAVAAAKAYIEDMFADEQIKEMGLEEVEFEDETNCWNITIGFKRPWDKNALAETMKGGAFRRSYKVVAINDQ